MELAIFVIISYAAAVAATLAGFGSSTLLIPVAIHFMEVKTAVLIVACFHLFNNLFKIRLFFKKIDTKIFLLFGVPSIVFAFLGAYLINFMPIEALKRIIGIFLIVFAIYSLIRPQFSLKQSNFTAILGGSFSGFFAGLIGLGGAIRGASLIAFNLAKEVYVGTSAMIAFVIDLTRIPTYILTGTVQFKSYTILLLFLILSAYLGVRTGKVLLKRIDQKTFRRIVAIALLLAGIKIMI